MSIKWNGRLRRIGTGWVISIPKIIVEEAELKEGELFECEIKAKLEYKKREL